MPKTESIFIEKVSEVHLLSWHRDQEMQILAI